MGIYNFPKSDKDDNNFTVPSLTFKSGCTFNFDSVSSEETCEQVQTLRFNGLGLRNTSVKFYNFTI